MIMMNELLMMSKRIAMVEAESPLSFSGRTLRVLGGENIKPY